MDVSKCHVCGELNPLLVDGRSHFGLEKSNFQNTVLHCGKDTCVTFAKKALINNFAQSGKYLYDKDNVLLKKNVFIYGGKNKCHGYIICYDNNTSSVIVFNESDSMLASVDKHVSVPINEACCSDGWGDAWGTLEQCTYIDFIPIFPENITKEKKDEIIKNLKRSVNSVKIHEDATVTKVNVNMPRSSGAIDNDWKVVRYVKMHMHRYYRYMTEEEKLAHYRNRRFDLDDLNIDKYPDPLEYNPPSIFCRSADSKTTKAIPMTLFIKHNPTVKAGDFKVVEVSDDLSFSNRDVIGDGYDYSTFEYEFNRACRINVYELSKQTATQVTKAKTPLPQPQQQQCCIIS